MKRFFSFTFLLGCVVLAASFTQTDLASRISRIEKGLIPPVLIKGGATWTIEERMKHYKAPGVTVAVINNFKVEWAKAYGVKDVGTKEPVTIETLFQAGSISKPVAAMVALRKVQDGKIALDEDINKTLVSWKLPDNDLTAAKKVTLTNLLSHTGGLTVHGFPGYAVGKPIPTLPQVLDGADPANTAAVRVDIPVGSRFRYSGGGSTIAQLAIMDIEKKPYPQIARDTVLDPLAMTNSTYSQPLPDDWRKKVATGYRGNGNEVEGKIHVYPEMAAAGLWTTPSDLAKFAIEVQLSLDGRSNKVLKKEVVEKMVTPVMEGAPGLGFFIEKRGASLYFGHGGADEGFRANLLVHRTKGYGAVVMVNSDNGQIINEIFGAIAREYNWDEFLPTPKETVAVDSTRLDEYVGRFKVTPDRVLTVSKTGAGLFAQPSEGPGFQLFPLSLTTFQRTDQDVTYTFVRSESGKVDTIELKFGATSNTAARISAETLIPLEMLNAGRLAEAFDGYRKIKKETPQHGVVSEQRLNGLGYTLLQQNKLREAIGVFKLNLEFYPNSSNVYDSLGEAYMQNGEKELAIVNYRKSVELNPKNTSGAAKLRKLEGR